MGRKQRTAYPGLRFRSGVWHIEKTIKGKRIYESTGTGRLEEAKQYLVHRLEQIRCANVYGERPKRIFREAAIKYLQEKTDKASLRDDAEQLKILDPFIGTLDLDKVNMGYLQPFIELRRKQGVKNRTINKALQVVRHLVNLASGEWVDEFNLTWLATAPKIKLLPETDQRKAYPLSWEEQDVFFEKLPLYLQRMSLFKVNTGLRDQEVCKLRWEWEHSIPELNTSVFVVPGERTKNGLDRLVVLNDIAKQVIEEVRGEHPIYVFTCARWGNRIIHRMDDTNEVKPGRCSLYQMNNKSWQKVRKETGLFIRVHDLKHTFGRRLRAAGVSFEDRQDLLGHKSSRITTHYSAGEIQNLIHAANKVCRRGGSASALTIIKNARENVIPFVPSARTCKTTSLSTVEQSKAQRDSGKIPARVLPDVEESYVSP
jgi:integrase